MEQLFIIIFLFFAFSSSSSSFHTDIVHTFYSIHFLSFSVFRIRFQLNPKSVSKRKREAILFNSTLWKCMFVCECLLAKWAWSY